MLSQDELDAIFSDKVLPHYLSRTAHVPNNKKLIILGGPGGSGKTFYAQVFNFISEYAYISADDIKNYHPHYRKLQKLDDTTASDLVQSVCNYLTNILKHEFIKLGKNVIIEGTLRDASVILSTVTEFNGVGYSIQVHVIMVPNSVSLVSAFVRYEEEKKTFGIARFVQIAKHAEAAAGIAGTLDTVSEDTRIDNITLVGRKPNGFRIKLEYRPGIDAKDELLRRYDMYVHRPLTSSERQYVHKSLATVRKLANARGAPAEYLNEIDSQIQTSNKVVATVWDMLKVWRR